MSCGAVERELTACKAGEPTSNATRRHLDGCPHCARFDRRLRSVELAMREHRSRTTAPPGFATAVGRLLPQDRDLIGWAALRLLPATIGLLLLLSWLNLQQARTAGSETSDPTEAVLSWVLEPTMSSGDSS